jgi:putative membrane protein
MMFGMGFFGVFFWILIIGLVFWGVQQILQSNRNSQQTGQISGPGENESVLEILKKRYARGEITREQFESMKKDLLA